jgi:hypothetical protein
MDRRTIIRSLLGLMAAPYFAHAQARGPAGKISYLTLDTISPGQCELVGETCLAPTITRH